MLELAADTKEVVVPVYSQYPQTRLITTLVTLGAAPIDDNSYRRKTEVIILADKAIMDDAMSCDPCLESWFITSVAEILRDNQIRIHMVDIDWNKSITENIAYCSALHAGAHDIIFAADREDKRISRSDNWMRHRVHTFARAQHWSAEYCSTLQYLSETYRIIRDEQHALDVATDVAQNIIYGAMTGIVATVSLAPGVKLESYERIDHGEAHRANSEAYIVKRSIRLRNQYPREPCKRILLTFSIPIGAGYARIEEKNVAHIMISGCFETGDPFNVSGMLSANIVSADSRGMHNAAGLLPANDVSSNEIMNIQNCIRDIACLNVLHVRPAEIKACIQQVIDWLGNDEARIDILTRALRGDPIADVARSICMLAK